MKITVLGSGGWGIALAMSAERNGHSVTLWSPFDEEILELSTQRESKRLLKGIKIPEDIKMTTNISISENSDITIIAVPSIAVKETAIRLKEIKNPGIVVNVAKGLEATSLKRLSEVISDEITAPVVVLSGPSHAEEVARKVPTSLVASSKDLDAAKKVIDAFSNEYLRLYTNDDMVGVELGGALKNVIALAAGAVDGLGYGDNTKAALITRGITEIYRLGTVMGGRAETFSGLTGIGDLIVTCASKHSRNRRAGILIGKGYTMEEAMKEVQMVVEGVYSAKAARALAKKYNVSMPIVEEVNRVLFEGKPAKEAVADLMLRDKRIEHSDLPWE